MSFDPRAIDAQIFDFATNTVVRASAGTGKTEALTTLYVICLAGANALGRRIAPREILALTFTEKAAAEMRDRIRHAVLRLAQIDPNRSPEDGDPPLVRRYLEQVRRHRAADPDYTPPTQVEWLQIHRDLGESVITTFHSFCAKVLRRHARQAGVDPAFELLEEAEARELLEQAARQAVREALEEAQETASQAAATSSVARSLPLRRLVGDYGYECVVRVLCEIGRRCLDRGWSAGDLRARGHLWDPEAPSAGLARIGRRLAEATRRFVDHAREVHGREPLAPRDLGALDDLEAIVSALEGKTDVGPETLQETVGALGRAVDRRLTAQRVRAARDFAKKRWQALGSQVEAWGRCEAVQGLADAFVELLDGVLQRYQALKAERGSLDFSDLVVRARDLLSGDEALRSQLSDRFQVLLVDEAQDTDPVQIDVIEAVHRAGDGRLRPSGLFVVGDRKQSIYRFRGADLEGFERFAATIEREGGQAVPLRTSYRSVPPLLEAANTMSARSVHGYEPDQDDLQPAEGPWPAPDAMGPRVELLSWDLEEEAGVRERKDSEKEAVMIARRFRRLLDEGFEVREPRGPNRGRLRPVRPGDLALLLPRFTQLSDFLTELDRVGLAAHVVKGRGFYEAQEVADVAYALKLLAAPEDRLAAAAVLRSPFVGLSDQGLTELFTSPLFAAKRGAEEHPWATLADGGVLPGEEGARLARFSRLFLSLLHHGDRLGPSAVLRRLIEDSGYAAVTAARPDAAQRLANLEKLAAQAEHWEAHGKGDLKRFTHVLWAKVRARRRAWGETEREALAPVEEEEAGNAVRVMTIHQSKGLDFPVVAVAELGRGTKNPLDPICLVDGDLCMKLCDGQERLPTGRWGEAQESEKAAAEAERGRLFYVAVTRARDLLILAGVGSRESPEHQAIQALLECEHAPRLVRVRKASEFGTAGPPADPPCRLERLELPAVQAALARVARRRPLPVRRIVLPVTALRDHALCARRYQLLHELGLEEHPQRIPNEAEEEAAEAPALEGTLLPATVRGSRIHRLLEWVDFEAYEREGRAHLDALARRLGIDLGSGGAVLVDTVHRFLEGDYGQHLRRTPGLRILREEPFVLVGRDGDLSVHLTGQIDLMVLGPDGVDVVDYKFSKPDSAEDYRFQLECYATAARLGFGASGDALRAGIQFLRDGAAAGRPQWLDTLSEPKAVLERIGRLGRSLLEAREGSAWEGQPRATCRAIRCGYLSLCHPS